MTARDDRPKVSVLVTTFNHERSVKAALESVLAQKTTFPTEAIICDDASTDGTRGVIKLFADRYDDWIRLSYREAHIGDGGTENLLLGLDVSQGEYVAILNGDDCWSDSGMLQQLAAFLDENAEYSVCVRESAIVVRRSALPELREWAHVLCDWRLALAAAPAETLGRVDGVLRALTPSDEQQVCVSCYLAAAHYETARNFAKAKTFLSRALAGEPDWLEPYCGGDGLSGEEFVRRLARRARLYRFPPLLRLSDALARLETTRHWRRVAAALRARFRTRGGPSGSITASPNPATAVEGHRASVTLEWQSTQPAVEIRLGRPDGRLVSRGAFEGKEETGNWVGDGMIFYLQDVTDGSPLSFENTLDAVRVTVRGRLQTLSPLIRLRRRAGSWIEELRWQRTYVAVQARAHARLERREAVGFITASPNPTPMTARGASFVTLRWTTASRAVEVRVGRPDGELLSHTRFSGEKRTGDWVKDGTIFYLQNVLDGLPLTLENTLDAVRVRVDEW